MLLISLSTSSGPIGPAGLPGQPGRSLAPKDRFLDWICCECHRCLIMFVFTGPKGDRGYKGDQGEAGISVRTSESVSSTRNESEYFFVIGFSMRHTEARNNLLYLLQNTPKVSLYL